MIEKECILVKAEQWEQLVNKLHFLDLKILEHIYVSHYGTTYFADILRKMDKLNVKRTAIRKHLHKLEELGLIELVKSSILLINSIPRISENVKKLICLCKMRWDI